MIPMTRLTDEHVRGLFYPESIYPTSKIPEGAHGQKQFASFAGQQCPKCHHGTLDNVGDCPTCDFSFQDHCGPY